MNTIVNDRIDIRISREQKELIQQASTIRGYKSVSEFVVSCVSKETKEILAEDSQIVKSMEDKRIFVHAILNPPAPNAALKKGYLDCKKFKQKNGPVNRNFGKKAR